MRRADYALMDYGEPADDLGAFLLPDELGEPGGPHDPRAIAADLVAHEEAHHHLRMGEAVILFLMRSETKVKQGKMELGSMSLTVFSGKNGDVGKWLLVKMCGALPDFIMILDADFWRQASSAARYALVDHELMHGAIKLNGDGEEIFTDDGRPCWAIKPHDLEEFDRIVAKHGAWSPDIARFLAAAGTAAL